MSIATVVQTTARTKPARTRRPTARLELVIAGTRHEVRAFEDADIDLTVSGWMHVLRGPGGDWFSIYDPGLTLAEMRAIAIAYGQAPDSDAPFRRVSYHCEGACRSRDCDHVNALLEVGLL